MGSNPFILKSFLSTGCGLVLLLNAFSLPSLANSSSNLRQGLPGRRISGGVRLPDASCFTDFNQSVVAILPRSIIGKTAEAHPTFWFSTPEFGASKTVAFELFSRSDELIYSAQLEISDEHGLSEFKLPETAPALVIGEDYRWVFSVACDTAKAPALGVQGIVHRVDLTDEVAAQIEAATPTEKLALYEAAQLWHEQVTTLIGLRREHSFNRVFQFEWAALIESIGLSSEVSSNVSPAMTAIEPTALSNIISEQSFRSDSILTLP